MTDLSRRPECDAAASEDNICGQSDSHAQRDMYADDKTEFRDSGKEEHERDEGEQNVERSVDGR